MPTKTPSLINNQSKLNLRWNSLWLITAIFTVLLLAIGYFAVPYVRAAGEITYNGCINCPPSNGIAGPTDTAIDSQGNIYVLMRDVEFGGVAKFSSAGTLLTRWGGYGSDLGNLGSGPYGIAADASDNIYVADTGNNRIQKFGSNGQNPSSFGAYGTAEGQFNAPKDIVVDGLSIYVVDQFNHRIQKFDNNWNFVMTWGWGVDDGSAAFQICTSGCQAGASNSGGFSAPDAITVDSNHDVYVYDDSRVQKFSSTGTLLNSVGSSGSGSGEFSGSYGGVDVDSSDNLYVVDDGNSRVQKFNSAGVFQESFGGYGNSANDEFSSPQGIMVDTADNVYVSDSGNSRVQKFSNAVYQQTFGTSLPGWSQGLLASGAGIMFGGRSDTDSQGNLYIPEIAGNRVSKYNSSGVRIGLWGGYGSGPGEFSEPTSVAVDPSDMVYVSDTLNGRIQKFDSSGNQLQEFGGYGSGDQQLDTGYGGGIALDGASNVYVADTNNHRIQRFNSAGVSDLRWGSYGMDAGGEMNKPNAVAIDSSGNIYVADGENPRIQKFSSSGTFIMMWGWGVDDGSQELQVCTSGCQAGLQGRGTGQFYNLSDISIDSADNIYISDGMIGVMKFDTSGNYIGKYSQVLTDTPLVYSQGLAIDKQIPGLLHASSYFWAVNLCDTDVSTNNCSGPNDGGGNSGGGGESSTYFYNNSFNDSITYLIAPDTATNFSLSGVDYASLQKDGSNLFPAGLTSFNFDTTPNSATTITIYYDLPGAPTGYTARKYNTANQTYADIPGATITREDYSGKSRLKLTYSITDNGELDQDPTPGHVVDPVGLATTSTFLASTGLNFWLYVVGAISLLGVGSYLVRQYSRR